MCCVFSYLSIYYTQKNMKKPFRKNNFKISATWWNDNFELPDESFLLSNIPNHFEHIIKKHETQIENPPIRIYISTNLKTELYLK